MLACSHDTVLDRLACKSGRGILDAVLSHAIQSMPWNLNFSAGGGVYFKLYCHDIEEWVSP